MIEGIASSASRAAQLQQAVETSVGVVKKVQDQAKLEGQAAVGLIETSGQIGQAPPTGDHTGQHVNVRA